MARKILLVVAVIIVTAAFMAWAQEQKPAPAKPQEEPTAQEEKPAAEQTQEEPAVQPEKKVVAEPQEEEAPVVEVTVETELCSGIEERMPTGMASSFPPDVDKVYLWCKVLGADDETMVKHCWYYKGEEMAVVELPVRSDSWRTWSYKTILPEWTGDWEVKVMDAGDNVLISIPFTIAAAGQP